MNCEACGKVFSGEVPWNQHINSEKHKKKVALNNYLGSAGNNNVVPSNQNVTLPCEACNISCDSVDSFQRHSLSLEHVTNVSKMYSKNEEIDAAIDMPSTARNDSKTYDGLLNLGLSSSDETDSILPELSNQKMSHLSYLSCKTCNKQFSGPESYKQHIESVAHKKKVDFQNVSAGAVQSILSPLSCDMCKKMFSGQIPYEQHMNSDAHKRKLQNTQFLEKWKEMNFSGKSALECDSSGDLPNGISDTNGFQMENNPFFCKLCNVPCSGLAPFQQHVVGETHTKNLRRSQFQLRESSISNLGYKSGDSVLFDEKSAVSTHTNGILSSASDVGREEIIPQMIKNLEVMSFEELNLKEFLPEDTLDFDDTKINENKDLVENKNDHNSSSKDQFEEVQNETADHPYEECQCCNVRLYNKKEALDHFESIDHFTRRWHFEKSSLSRID